MPRNAFDPNGAAVVASPFVFAGVSYARGKSFPHKDLKLPTVELRGLWLANQINFAEAPPPARPAKQLRR